MLEYFLPRLTIFLLAAMPVVELRLSIPLGILFLKLPPVDVYIWSVIGNFLPMYFILKYLDFFMTLLFKIWPYLHKHVQKYFNKLHKKHSKKYNYLGGVFLALFVAIPLPGSGGWTGAALAYLFNLPTKIALPSLLLGIIGSAFFTTMIHTGVLKAWQFFF